MLSTGRIFVVACLRQYRQGASKVNLAELDLDDGRLNRSIREDGAQAANLTLIGFFLPRGIVPTRRYPRARLRAS
jgi:hypothetical protein